jgi:hypothetical protein
MSDLQIEEVTDLGTDDVEAPPQQEFCHIDDGSGIRFYCGKLNEDLGHTCQPYAGEAICPSCGLANCPSCTLMSSLEERLDEI